MSREAGILFRWFGEDGLTQSQRTSSGLKIQHVPQAECPVTEAVKYGRKEAGFRSWLIVVWVSVLLLTSWVSKNHPWLRLMAMMIVRNAKGAGGVNGCWKMLYKGYRGSWYQTRVQGRLKELGAGQSGWLLRLSWQGTDFAFSLLRYVLVKLHEENLASH